VSYAAQQLDAGQLRLPQAEAALEAVSV